MEIDGPAGSPDALLRSSAGRAVARLGAAPDRWRLRPLLCVAAVPPLLLWFGGAGPVAAVVDGHAEDAMSSSASQPWLPRRPPVWPPTVKLDTEPNGSSPVPAPVTEEVTDSMAGPVIVFLFLLGFLVQYVWARHQRGRGAGVRELTAFRRYRKGMRRNSSCLGWDNVFTMRFTIADDELRFVADNADLTCRRISHVAIAVILAVLIHLVWKGRRVFDHPLTTHGGMSYVSSGLTLFGISLFMFLQTWLWRQDFSALKYMELLIMIWLALLMIVGHIFFLHKFGNLREEREFSFVFAIAVLIHILCVHTPLRFTHLFVYCGIAPAYYWVYMRIQVSMGIYTHRTVPSTVGEYDVDVLCFVLLATTSVGALMAKHGIEWHKRLAWIAAYHSYKMLRCVEEEKKDVDGTSLLAKTKAAMIKVAQAFDILSTYPHLLPLEVQQIIQLAKTNADFAQRSLQRADGMFHMTAEQILDGHQEFEGKAEMLNFINASQPETWAALNTSMRAEDLSSLRRSRRTATLNSFYDSEEGESKPAPPPVRNCVTVVSDADICAGFGEDYGFSALDLSRRTRGFGLVFAGEKALIRNQLCDKIGINRDVFRAWLREIRVRYQDTAYHNEAHGTQVLALGACLAHASGWIDKADVTHTIALYVACIAHDVGHFGRNNMFCSKTEHAVAMIWNDVSVLENMHAAICFNVMQGPADFLDPIEYVTRMKLRKYIIRFILSTDIKDHHSSLARLNSRMEDGTFLKFTDDNLGEDAHAKFEEDVVLAGESLIKAGDIGHALMPWEPHREWSYRVTTEFYCQGDEERKLGLPISPMCDRNAKSNFAGSQAFFIDVFTSAVVKVIRKYTFDEEGQAKIDAVLQCGKNNIELWKKEDVLDPKTLDEGILADTFGEGAKEPVFPYDFERDKLNRMEIIKPDQNLKDLVEQDISFDAMVSMKMSVAAASMDRTESTGGHTLSPRSAAKKPTSGTLPKASAKTEGLAGAPKSWSFGTPASPRGGRL